MTYARNERLSHPKLMTHDELEFKIEKTNIAIKKLSIDIENIMRNNDALFRDLNVTPAQVSTFISNKDYFTEDNWKTIVEQKHQLEEKLKRELANIRNPQKVKKTQAERAAPRHWLFVR